MAVYTDLKKEDIENILKEYNLKLNSFYKIKKGILNTNYFVSTDCGDFVIRVFEGNRTFKEENLELEFLLDIQNIIPCCVPIKNIKNNNYVIYNNKMVALFKYIKGLPIDKINEKLIRQIANYLGKLHNYSMGKSLNRDSRVNLQYYYDNIDFNKIEIDDKNKEIILKRYKEIKDIDFNILPKGIIHNDIFPDNILIDCEDNIVGILDFNESCSGPFIFDIAIVINFWIKILKLNKDIENRYIQLFLSEYNKVRKLSCQEVELLEYSIIATSLTFILLRIYKFEVEKVKKLFVEDKNYEELMVLV